MDSHARLWVPELNTYFEMVFPKPYQAPMALFCISNAGGVAKAAGAAGRNIATVVDVGAQLGQTLLSLRVSFPLAHIISIEPSSYNYPYMEKNAKNTDNYTLVKMAAGPYKGKVRIACPLPEQRNDRAAESINENSGMLSVFGRGTGLEEEVEMDTLDSMLGHRKVDYLKIDVEGFEAEVLYGAREILERDKPILQIEIRELNQRYSGRTEKQLQDYINSLGYVAIGVTPSQDWLCFHK